MVRNAGLETQGVPSAERLEHLQAAVKAEMGVLLSTATLANYVAKFRVELANKDDLQSIAGPGLRKRIVNHKKSKT